jgi:hypothetical protein
MGAIRTATDLLRARALGAALAYEGRNMSLRQGGRVHIVGTVDWVDGVQAPAPACHTASAAGPLVGAIPTDRAVNCRKCLGRRPVKRPARRAGRARPARRATAHPLPLPLFDLD